MAERPATDIIARAEQLYRGIGPGRGSSAELSTFPPIFAIRTGSGADPQTDDPLRLLMQVPPGMDASRLIAYAVTADGRAVQLTTRRMGNGLAEFAIPGFTNFGSIHTIALSHIGEQRAVPFRVNPAAMDGVFRQTYGFGLSDQSGPRGVRPRILRIAPCSGQISPNTIAVGLCFSGG